ncbi:MAG: hypothetical protein GF331_07350 [Chitinivibrionales bacterium]|nr:hypothetical protein [Chitinivibrionales bacterium]
MRCLTAVPFPQANEGVVLNRNGLKFNARYFVRPITYRHTTTNDLAFASGRQRTAKTTERALVTADMDRIYHVTEEDQGANPEYKWRVLAFDKRAMMHPIHSQGQRASEGNLA